MDYSIQELQQQLCVKPKNQYSKRDKKNCMILIFKLKSTASIGHERHREVTFASSVS